ncbi:MULTISPECIES: hypothetical protein [Okeania]|nr:MULTISPECIES: hypothetical protein [Okeania]
MKLSPENLSFVKLYFPNLGQRQKFGRWLTVKLYLLDLLPTGNIQ